jgi:hypothetical protein
MPKKRKSSKKGVTSAEIRKAERAYLASSRAEARYSKMFKTNAYNKLPYGKQLKYADQWGKSQTKTRKAFNKVLALRKKNA